MALWLSHGCGDEFSEEDGEVDDEVDVCYHGRLDDNDDVYDDADGDLVIGIFMLIMMITLGAIVMVSAMVVGSRRSTTQTRIMLLMTTELMATIVMTKVNFIARTMTMVETMAMMVVIIINIMYI